MTNEPSIHKKVQGDVHHLIAPVIGQLRWRKHKGQLTLDEKDIDYFVKNLYAALDIVDIAAGASEKTREQMAYEDLGLGF